MRFFAALLLHLNILFLKKISEVMRQKRTAARRFLLLFSGGAIHFLQTLSRLLRDSTDGQSAAAAARKAQMLIVMVTLLRRREVAC